MLTFFREAEMQELVFPGTGTGQLSLENAVLEAWAEAAADAACQPLRFGPVHSDAEDERFGLLPAGSLNNKGAVVVGVHCWIGPFTLES